MPEASPLLFAADHSRVRAAPTVRQCRLPTAAFAQEFDRLLVQNAASGPCESTRCLAVGADA